MRLIKPSEISASILTLIDESDERVILVSPYMKISKWYKFIKKLTCLNNRNISAEIYVRDDPDNLETYRDLDRLGLEYKKIHHLHCKLYMNERYGIVSSMNLLLSSDIHSLEIGYATETWTEYSELLGFFHRYIHMGEHVQCATLAGRPAADLKRVIRGIRDELRKNTKDSWLWLGENALQIFTGGNNYTISISGGNLKINALLFKGSSKSRKLLPPFSVIAKKIEELTTLKVEIHSESKQKILRISGHAPRVINSTSIEGMLEADAGFIMESVIRFVNATEDLRN